jgi:hypothetical protein
MRFASRPPSRVRLAARLACLLPILLSGCDHKCPPRVDPASGSYRSQGGRFVLGTAAYRGVATAKELTLDERKGVVTVTYVDEGRVVVERYRVKSARTLGDGGAGD